MSQLVRVLGMGAVAFLASCGQQEEEIASAQQSLCSMTCTCGASGDAYANSRGTTGECAHDVALLTQPIETSIETAGDVDWFKFTTTANSGFYTYRFNTDRANGAVSTTDTYCDIYATATTPYASRYNNNDPLDTLDPVTGGPNCLVTLATNLSNTVYYVRVRHASALGTGAYALSMTSGPSGVGDPCVDNGDCSGGTCVLGACTAALPDADGDGFPDDLDGIPEDNCTNVANPDQADCDIDGIGDACDSTDDSETTGGDCSVQFMDITPPDVTVPADIIVAATSASGNVVSFSASATDDIDGDVDVSCTPASGSTFPIGTTTVNCTASDVSGNEGSASFTVSVQYAWDGVLQPVNADGSSIFKLGRTVPVKFKLTGPSGPITDAIATLTLQKVSNSCSGDEVEAISTAAASSGNEFRYDATDGQYIFNLATSSLSVGTWKLIISLGDGVSRTVLISLK